MRHSLESSLTLLVCTRSQRDETRMTGNNDPQTGQRLSYDGALCTVRYIGPVSGTAGDWLGVEWDDPSRGRHDGSHKGVRCFTCRSSSSGTPTHASTR